MDSNEQPEGEKIVDIQQAPPAGPSTNLKEVQIDESGAISNPPSSQNSSGVSQAVAVNEVPSAQNPEPVSTMEVPKQEQGVGETQPQARQNHDNTENTTQGEVPNEPATVIKPKKVSRAPKLAIIVAVVITLVLVVVAIVAFSSMKQNDEKTDKESGQNSQPPEVQTAVTSNYVGNIAQGTEAEINKTNNLEEIPAEESARSAKLGR